MANQFPSDKERGKVAAGVHCVCACVLIFKKQSTDGHLYYNHSGWTWANSTSDVGAQSFVAVPHTVMLYFFFSLGSFKCHSLLVYLGNKRLVMWCLVGGFQEPTPLAKSFCGLFPFILACFQAGFLIFCKVKRFIHASWALQHRISSNMQRLQGKITALEA